jgi:hypothetical protein
MGDPFHRRLPAHPSANAQMFNVRIGINEKDHEPLIILTSGLVD